MCESQIYDLFVPTVEDFVEFSRWCVENEVGGYPHLERVIGRKLCSSLHAIINTFLL